MGERWGPGCREYALKCPGNWVTLKGGVGSQGHAGAPESSKA